MSHSLRLKAKPHREPRTDASIAPSGAQYAENILARPNETVDENVNGVEMSTDRRRESWGSVVSSIENDTDAIVSTMEWRRAVLQSQEESRAASIRQHREERWRAKLDAKIERTRLHYHKQEKVLEREVEMLEQRYEWTMAQLEREEQDEESYFVDGWEAQSDYQPTECGEGSGSLMPEHKQQGQ